MSSRAGVDTKAGVFWRATKGGTTATRGGNAGKSRKFSVISAENDTGHPITTPTKSTPLIPVTEIKDGTQKSKPSVIEGDDNKQRRSPASLRNSWDSSHYRHRRHRRHCHIPIKKVQKPPPKTSDKEICFRIQSFWLPLKQPSAFIFLLETLKNRGFDFFGQRKKILAQCSIISRISHQMINALMISAVTHTTPMLSCANTQAEDYIRIDPSRLLHAKEISTISDYDLGGVGDLFKAPEPIIEQPLVTLDHMTPAMSVILCEEEAVSQEIKVTDPESLQNGDFPSNLFFKYKDILAKESSFPSEVLKFELPTTKDDIEENLHSPEKITKSASSISLSSVDGDQIRPSGVNSNEIELKKVHGMRRVFSEGYIKPQLIDHTTETRMQKLSRYRDKKTKRNFGRKIKYACRKVLADGQPRIRGRFAKTEETDILTRK
ncbi:hypothetical protein L6452_05273 [Arctium lappa]|uniref:Uncharacterized protein n=1 Tax=Arctium lappa TaxID=4217 RepID=A0ACB9EGE1_ARCLA|nr:hypothetical protein L6452_05273 [Arctium lappa]